MLRFILLLILLANCINSYSQDSVLQLVKKIYYNTSEYRLTPGQAAELNEFFLSVSKHSLVSVSIEGNTDSVGSVSSNDTLSFRRASEVKNYILAKGFATEQAFRLTWNGELKPVAGNDSEEGRQQNRRTDITIVVAVKLPPVFVPEVEDCNADTLIRFPKGTVLQLKKCEYDRLKECLTVKEMYSPEDVAGTDLSTMTINGELMTSCGMIDISIGKPCRDSCFRYPITVLMPANPPKKDTCRSCDNDGQLYFSAGGGTWANTPASGVMEYVTIDGKDYYRFTVRCPGKYNCDCRKPTKKVKFKARGGLRIEKLEVIYECPLVVSRFVNGSAKRKIRIKAYCYETRKLLNVVATDKSGNRYYINRQPLENFEFRASRPPCKIGKNKTVIRRFLFWKFYKSPVYRKYVLHKDQFTN